jgi:hypothetical protein
MSQFKDEVFYLFTVISGVAVTLMAFNSLDKNVVVLQTKTTSMEERLKRIETILETKYGVTYDPDASKIQVQPNNNTGKALHKRTI